MIGGRLAAAALLWLVGFLAHAQVASPTPYVVLEHSGTVKTQSVGGVAGDVQALANLPVGALVTLEAGAVLVLYGGNPKSLFRFIGPGSHTLAAAAPVAGPRSSAAAREALPEQFKNLRLNVPSAAQASLVMRDGREDRVKVLAPEGALLPGEVPRLKWLGGAARAPFRLDIADWQGNHVARGESVANEWVPELDATLTPGTRYRFSVFGRPSGSRTGESDFGEFRVVSEKDAVPILAARPADDAALYLKRLYAVRLKELRLLQAAVDYEQAISAAK